VTRDPYPGYREGTLRPESVAILEQLAAGEFPPLDSMTPADARKAFVLPEWLGDARADVGVRETSARGVPVRVYVPDAPCPLPVLVFFHGGGFVVGDLGEFEPFCTYLAAGAVCIVVSVGYRLAPESPFPAALDDAWAATRWAASEAASFGGDPARVAVAGDSSGGNLAAAVTMLARDAESPRLSHQVLLCPWVDLSAASESTDSFASFGDGLWLSTAGIRWYRSLYLRDADRLEDPRVSPLLAPDMSGLPPALVVTAEFDVLSDQGSAYADRLAGRGVPVVHHRYAGMLHDFATLPGLFPSAWEAIDEIAAFSRAAFGRASSIAG
jgi:acetyl esterase